VHWSVNNASRYGGEANVFRCILDRRVKASMPPFVIIGADPSTPAIGLTTDEAVMRVAGLGDASALLSLPAGVL